MAQSKFGKAQSATKQPPGKNFKAKETFKPVKSLLTEQKHTTLKTLGNEKSIPVLYQSKKVPSGNAKVEKVLQSGIICDYEIGKMIGSGTFGTVFKVILDFLKSN